MITCGWPENELDTECASLSCNHVLKPLPSSSSNVHPCSNYSNPGVMVVCTMWPLLCMSECSLMEVGLMSPCSYPDQKWTWIEDLGGRYKALQILAIIKQWFINALCNLRHCWRLCACIHTWHGDLTYWICVRAWKSSYIWLLVPLIPLSVIVSCGLSIQHVARVHFTL